METVAAQVFEELRNLWQAGYRGDIQLHLGNFPTEIRVDLMETARGPAAVRRLCRDRAARTQGSGATG